MSRSRRGMPDGRLGRWGWIATAALFAVGLAGCTSSSGSLTDSDRTVVDPTETSGTEAENAVEGFGLRFAFETPTIEWATNVSGYLQIEARVTNLTDAPASFEMQADILCPGLVHIPSQAKGIPHRFFPDSIFGPFVELDPYATVDIMVGPIPFVNVPTIIASCLPTADAPRYLVMAGTPYDKPPGPDGMLVEDPLKDDSYPGLVLPFDFSVIQAAEPDLPSSAIDPLLLCASVRIDELADLGIAARDAVPGLFPNRPSCQIGRAGFFTSAAEADKNEWRERIIGQADNAAGLQAVDGVDNAFIRDREAIIERGDSIIVVFRATPALDEGALEGLVRLLAEAAEQQLPTA